MTTSVKRLAVALACTALALVCAPAAHADGDPAGDVLANQTVFYGSALDLRSKEAAQLPALLKEAKAKGLDVRVAALSVQQDLGAIDYLWDDPLNYVEFLAAELDYIFQGRTLVVMPSGYAVFRPGHSSVRENRLLEKVEPAGEDPTKVIPGAMDAVIRLARARGITLTVPDVESAPGGIKQPVSHFQQQNAPAPARPGVRTSRAPVAAASGGTSAWLFGVPVLLLVAAAIALIARARLRERKVPQ